MKGGPPPVALKKRFSGDGLTSDGQANVLGCDWARLSGTGANEYLDFSWYQFGALVAFRSARGAGGIPGLEFWGYNPDTATYQPVVTMMVASNTTGDPSLVDFRNPGDTAAYEIWGFPDVAEIGTETYTEIHAGILANMWWQWKAQSVELGSSTSLKWLNDVIPRGTSTTAVADVQLTRYSAGILGQHNADTTAQTFRVYGAVTGDKFAKVQHDATDAYFGANTGRLFLQDANGNLLTFSVKNFYPFTDNDSDLGITTSNRWKNLFLSGPAITAGGASTGFTVNDSGAVRRLIYKCTTTYETFAAAATTGDKTIATLPAKARVMQAYADTTTKYIGGAVATCTLRLGISAGGVEVIASHDVFTAAVTKGLLDADMGTSMTRAAAIQGGYMPSFTGTTTLVARITTTGANTNALTQGSTTWWLDVEVLQ